MPRSLPLLQEVLRMLPPLAASRLAASFMLAFTLLAGAGPASAESPPTTNAERAAGETTGSARAEPPLAPEPPARDAPSPAPAPDPWALVRRPWLYSTDPTAPPPGHALTSISVGYSQVDRDGSRPFAGDIAHAGAVFSAGA